MKNRDAEPKPCPFCGRTLVPGKLMTQGDNLSRLASDLCFERGDGSKEAVLERNATRTAWLCDDCGSIVAKGDFAD